MNLCILCLCDVCNRLRCPYRFKARRLNHCLRLGDLGVCPVLKCDYFVHKERRKVYRITRLSRRRDIYISKVDEILHRLDEIASANKIHPTSLKLYLAGKNDNK